VAHGADPDLSSEPIEPRSARTDWAAGWSMVADGQQPPHLRPRYSPKKNFIHLIEYLDICMKHQM